MTHQTIICATCGASTRPAGRGLCKRCYDRAHHAGSLPPTPPKIPKVRPAPKGRQYPARVRRECASCGVVIMLRPSASRRAVETFCSPACRARRVEHTCPGCGVRFPIKRSQLRAPGLHYCTKACWIADAYRRERVERVCATCGKPFTIPLKEAAKGRGKYCSVACRPDAPTRPTMACRHCGKVFRVRPWRLAAGQRKYCSEECTRAASIVDRITKTCANCGEGFTVRSTDTRRRYCSVRCQVEGRKAPRVSLTCKHCGAAFAVTASGATARFCSTRCRQLRSAVPKLTRTCPTCGESFECYPKYPKVFCSNACHLASYPEVSEAELIDRRRNVSRRWREAVLARDKQTCQDCGATDRPLNAHHIKPWAEYPELRVVLSNGLTLCEACHFAVHWPGLPNPYAI